VSTNIFDSCADRYEAVRPSYPDAAIEHVLARTTGRCALEIGAGPGKATLAFARRGLEIVALEPGPQLAAILRERTNALPVDVVEMRFEDYQGRDFDLVYAAQAFHWIDPAGRYTHVADVLRAGGTFALLSNEKAPMDTAIRAELDAAYRQHFGWEPWLDRIGDKQRTWVGEIEASGLFGPVAVERVPWQTTYSSDEYVSLLDTYSDHAARPERHALYADVRAAIEHHGGRIVVPYETLVVIARVTRPSS